MMTSISPYLPRSRRLQVKVESMKASFRMVQAYTSRDPPKSAPKMSPVLAHWKEPGRPMPSPGTGSTAHPRRSSLSSCADSNEEADARLRRFRQGSFLKVLDEEDEEEDVEHSSRSLRARALHAVFGIHEGDTRLGIPRSRCIHPSSLFYRGRSPFP